MARTPKPVKLKVLEGRGNGRDSGGRKVPQVPSFRRLAPAKPDNLSPAASAHWDQIVPDMQRLELLKPGDVGSLTLMCEAWARVLAAKLILEGEGIKGGLLTFNSQGEVQHPALVSLRADQREYRAWAQHFGLTPSSEAALKPREPSDAEENPFA